MSTPPKEFPDKICETCGKPFNRKRFNGRLEDPARYLSRRNCSQSCGNSRAEVARGSLYWRARRFRADVCEGCGTTEELHVHHIDRDPKNNSPKNLATLCASCHLKKHWREDREKRLAANPLVVAKRGATTPRLSTDTNSPSAV